MGQPELGIINDFDRVSGDELEAGHTLMCGRYTVEKILNSDGFGMSYCARDCAGRIVVIKECFLSFICHGATTSVQARGTAHAMELSSIVRLPVEGAHSVAQLDHPNAVSVHKVFEENNTSYMALKFIEGYDLLDVIEDPEEVETTLHSNFAASNDGETGATVSAGSRQHDAAYESSIDPLVQRISHVNNVTPETHMIDGAWTTRVVTASRYREFTITS